MDIILGYGFDDIRFGMLESEIITKLGLPDKKYESSLKRLGLNYTWTARQEI